MSENPKPCHSIGIQWGLWVWSESQYAWVGGSGAGVPPTPPPTPPTEVMSDNFNDNSLDSDKWVVKKFMKATKIDVFERNQRLEIALNVDDSGTSPKAGVRTKNKFDIADRTVITDIYCPNGMDYARSSLIITTEDIPENIEKDAGTWLVENNKDAYNMAVFPSSVGAGKITGGSYVPLGGISFALGAWTGKLRAVRTGNSIIFEVYKDGSWQSVGSDTCMFAGGTTLYVYLCSEDNWARSALHGQIDAWFDNFGIG